MTAGGKVDYYTVSITGAINNITQTNTTQVTFTGLLPGREYTVTVQTVRGNCSQTSDPVTEATYPTPVDRLTLDVRGTQSLTLSWTEPKYMSDVIKSYKITYGNSSATWTTTNTTTNAVLQNLMSGTNYTINVITVGVRGYQSSPVITSVYTLSSISLNNYNSSDTLGVSWMSTGGKVDYYTVSITGAINNIIQTNTTQVNFTGLLPGREYTVTVQTVSGSCSQTSDPKTEATYPTPVDRLTLDVSGAQNLTLSWTEPKYMSDVIKSYKITYGNSSANWTTTNTTTNVVLQNLMSGTNYTINVVTVGVRGYQSSPVITSVYTQPFSVKSLQVSNVTSYSVSLTWIKPDEYQTSYSYRVQTYVTSSDTMINSTIVTSESATILNLRPGETYTFMVYTRAADNITESDPVSLSTCTGLIAPFISLKNDNSADTLGVSWVSTGGKVDYYTVSITGAINNTIQTNTTQVTFTGLLPGREYTVTVQTVSGSCSQTSAPKTEATYPRPVDGLTLDIQAKNLTLSWQESANMSDVIKSYEITYGNSSGTWTETNTTNVTLQSLMSGTNYTINVITVGVRGYKSSPVSKSVYTKPFSVKSLQFSDVTSDSVSLTWSKPDEYQTSYIYRVQTNVTSSDTMINNTIVTSESTTILNLIPGETYTFFVYTRAADNITESDPVSLSTCTEFTVSSISLNNCNSSDTLGVSWMSAGGKVDYYTVSITGAINNITQTNTTQVNFTGLLPGREYNVTVQTVSGNCSQTSAPVTEATYPRPVDRLTLDVCGAQNLTLSWLEPANMSDVIKSYEITYGNSSGTWTEKNTTKNVTLQSLMSGTNYTINVITVGVRGYKSSSVSKFVYTSLLDQPNTIQTIQSVSNSSVDITFLPFDSSGVFIVAYAVVVTTNMNESRPSWRILSKTYSDFNNGLTKTYVTYIINQTAANRSESAYNVHVGDGTKTHSYVNGPLNLTLQYRFSIAGFSHIEYDPITNTINEEQSPVSFTQYATPIPVIPQSSNIGTIVGGVIGSLVGFSVLSILVFWFWRKRQHSYLPVGDYNPVDEDYEALFEKLQANNNKGFIEEFESLQPVGVLLPRSVALLPANAEKNREDAPNPYDRSRVKLSSVENSSDYINASYVPGYTSDEEFIAAQHPLPGTIKDFLCMIWEEHITTIVMLSDSLENFEGQGEEYWPNYEAKTFGNMIVTFVSKSIYNHWIIRDFMVTNVTNQQSHQVRQFHFTEWTEDCDMDYRYVPIQFVHQVRKYKKEKSSDSPTLVHCRTGIGRSGVFIALHGIIDQWEGDEKVDVYITVYKMHLHRPLMVQTQVQYIFLHRCTLDIVKDLIPIHVYENFNEPLEGHYERTLSFLRAFSIRRN